MSARPFDYDFDTTARCVADLMGLERPRRLDTLVAICQLWIRLETEDRAADGDDEDEI